MVFVNDVADTVRRIVDGSATPSPFIVTDRNVERDVMPLLGLDYPRVVIEPGDAAKTLDAARTVWDAMEECRLTRRSLVVNIGGGVVTDLGGFCAATFKRGVDFINVPTTLLGAVDAAFGGKTGINYRGLKNEIGCFAPAREVVVSTCFFATLPEHELLSGWAEMIKHSLLDSPAAAAAVLQADPRELDAGSLLALLRDNIVVKERIVASDPRERGPRKALNLGHTAGHAIEELKMERESGVPHGFAVAWGLVAACVVSRIKCALESGWLHAVAGRVRELYGSPGVACSDYPRLLELMHSDKKNASASEVAFTLLRAPGDAKVNVPVSDSDITAAIDITRDLLD